MVEDFCFCVFFVGCELVIVLEWGFIIGIKVCGLELKEVFLDIFILVDFGFWELIGLFWFKWFLVLGDLFCVLVMDDFWGVVVMFFLWDCLGVFVFLDVLLFVVIFCFCMDDEVGL